MKDFSSQETYIDFKYMGEDYTYRPFNSTIYKNKDITQFSITPYLANWINRLIESSAEKVLIELVRIYNAGGLRARDELKEKISKL